MVAMLFRLLMYTCLILTSALLLYLLYLVVFVIFVQDDRHVFVAG